MILKMKEIKNCSCVCLKGNIREKNEDNFYFAGEYLEPDDDGSEEPLSKTIKLMEDHKNGHLFAVFDGMGGGQHGEIASYEAARCTSEYILPHCGNQDEDPDASLDDLCKTINDRVYAVGEKARASVMGTTVAALYFRGNKVWSCNVGDSRCYRLRDGVLEKISEDHVEELYIVDMVRIKRKPGLIQYLGMDPEEVLIEPAISCSNLQRGDTYLICSDGLTDMLTEADIASILKDAGDAEEATTGLVSMALGNGGKDNITVIVCKC